MEIDGPRRSGRTRTKVTTFQSEQEHEAFALPVRKNSTKAKVKSESDQGTTATDKLINAEASTQILSNKQTGKKQTRDDNPDEFKLEDDSEQERPKKKKRAKKPATATGQLYGSPPAGTIIA